MGGIQGSSLGFEPKLSSGLRGVCRSPFFRVAVQQALEGGEGRWLVKRIQMCLDAASPRVASTLGLLEFPGFDAAAWDARGGGKQGQAG